MDSEEMIRLLQSQGGSTQVNSTDGDKTTSLDGSSGQNSAAVIEAPGNGDQTRYFTGLSDNEQMNHFNALGDKDQITLFKSLDSALKVKVYKNLNKTDQTRIYGGLSQSEQAELLEHITKEKGSSNIEDILSGYFPRDIDNELEQYGYDFFADESDVFKPLTNVPVGSDYIVGPGDSFVIYIWGGAEETHNVIVSREGNIIIPRIGTVNVTGLTFAEMKDFLGLKFRQYYNEFQMNITMGTLRAIDVYLVGEVKNPGTYSVSSLSTIVTALYATGGPTKNGSLRDIKLIRNGETVTSLDLYDFFIKGLKDRDARLEPGDTIFVPIIGPVVGISGYVKRPAIYEMKGSQTIGELIDLAGEVLSVSYLQNVVLERITDHQKRIVKTFNLDPNDEQSVGDQNTPLKDGDLIKIYPVNETMHQVVYLEGHVKYPRAYEFRDGLRLLDIIPSYDYLLNEPFLSVAEVVRLAPPDLHPETIKFSLDALLSGDETQNLELQDQDRIIIYGKWDKKDRPKVTINGQVKSPGTYYLVDDMTVKDLIFLAGNLSDNAYLENADLTRFIEGKDDTQSLTMKFSVRSALQENPEDNIILEPDDVIYIRSIPSYSKALNRKIYLEGEFIFPGEYSFSEGERLSSVISRAGGLSEDAYPFGAIFTRESVKQTQDVGYQENIEQLERDVASLTAIAANSSSLDKEDISLLQATMLEKQALLEKLRNAAPTGRMVINLDNILVSPSSVYDVQLRAGDHLTVPKREDFINISGEVYNQTALLYEEKRAVDYYLNKVGGVTKRAAKRQIYIVKANGTVISKQQGGLFGLGLWDEGNSRWSFGGFGSIELDPGDSIIVPQKTTRIAWLKGMSSVTSILYQLAVAAAVIQDF
ncbi:MAG: SLBB domain-containing protein [Deltaproteobacteria bacterium]|nr:SLBB domain-containing protein [Deltaproteobacteria bacterium]